MKKKSHSESVEEITANNIESVISLDRQLREHRSTTMRIVEYITAFSGSMRFIWIHLIWFTSWILNDKVFHLFPNLDPFPYQLLTLIVSLEAILLSTIILITQNSDTKIAERRNHLELQVALLTEQENTKMLKMLEQIGLKLGVKDTGDPSIKALEEATSTESLSRQIDSALKKLDRPFEKEE